MNDLILIFSGCYKGQETISRLITYDGVKQRLWGIRLSAPTEPGSPITINGKKVLVMTVMLLRKGTYAVFAYGREVGKEKGILNAKQKSPINSVN